MTGNSNGCQDISLKTANTNIMASLEEKSSLNNLCVFTKHYDNPSDSGWDFSGWTKTVDRSSGHYHTHSQSAGVGNEPETVFNNKSWSLQLEMSVNDFFSPAALQPFSERSKVSGS